VWVSAFADGGGEGGGYLPALNADGTKVTFVTDALDVVSSDGTLGGLVVSTVGATSVTSAAYASVKPNGNPSTGLIDTEYAPAISADGKCIAFKSNQGVDLLAGNSGPAEGIFLWDNRGASPVISLISKITTGQAATSATAPRITGDCSFIAYESNDDFISVADNNNKLDVFLYDIAKGTTQLISSNAGGDSADANSSLAALDFDPTTGLGVVMITSGASNIRGIAGGNADLDVFSVPFARPSAPTSLVATSGSAQASIAFTAPESNGGATITNYEYSTDNGTTWKAFSPADTTTPVVITTRSDAASALVNGTTYQVKLRAVNADGVGTASSAVSVTSGVAGAPTALVATAGSAQASIAFTAPESNGGATITNYEYSTDNGTTWKAFSPADATTPVVITIRSDAASALVNGTTYQVKLRAVNAVGSGAESSAVSVTPRTVAGAPTSLVATPGIQQASIAFTAPESDGGATITNYQYSTDNGTTWKAFSPADATTPVVITIRSDTASTALANGTTYQVKLRAVNAAGSGTASSAVSVTPRRVSGEPTSLVATSGNAQASIAFTAPVFNGGATITNYEYSTDNGTTWKALSPADATTPVVITTRSDAASALVNGTTYQVKLRTVNAAGSGTASSAVSVTPRTVAGEPTSLVATPGSAQASIAFTAPESNGGATITNYQYSTDNGTTWKAFSPADTTTPVVITIRSDAASALVNGTTYQVKLRAVTAAGSGTASSAVSVRPGVAGVPTSLVATSGNAQASIAFTAPTTNGGATITNYEYSTDNGTTWKAFSPADVTTPVVITIRSDAASALVNGTTYQVKLRSVNARGSGAESLAVSVTPRTVAGAPTSLVATPGIQQASIAFTAPASDGGATITNYQYSTDNGTTWKAFSPADATTPVVITIRSDTASTALANGTTYQVKLRAVNAAGSGTASSAVSVTPRRVSGEPTSLVATPGIQQASIAFTAPVFNGGATITNYEYSTDNGTTWKAFSPADATTPVVITTRSDAASALANGTTYRVKLRAVNAAGSGTASLAVSVTPRRVSGEPTSLRATPGNAQASIAFTAPVFNGGATITNYEYSTDNGTTWKAFSPADATTPVVITTRSDAASALVNGTTYQVKLRAVNAAGSGYASTAVSVTPQ
jgi:titin